MKGDKIIPFAFFLTTVIIFFAIVRHEYLSDVHKEHIQKDVGENVLIEKVDSQGFYKYKVYQKDGDRIIEESTYMFKGKELEGKL